MSDGGKGSKPRPLSVSVEEYNNRWDAIFARYEQEDKVSRNNEETQEVLAERWKYDGIDPHKHEYWYTCMVCGDSDWISSYGTPSQLSCKCK